jgi:intracellular multiplication protein IcmB
MKEESFMVKFVDSVLDGVDTFLAWMSLSLKQYSINYCDLETADSENVLVNHDGTLVSIVEVQGITTLVGSPEFESLISGLDNTFQSVMGRPGYAFQIFFSYDLDSVKSMIEGNFKSARATAQRLNLDLSDLFHERVEVLSDYCGVEKCYLALFTRPSCLNSEQYNAAKKEKSKLIRESKLPAFKTSQTLYAAYPETRENHDSYVRSILLDLASLNLVANLLNIHDAVRAIRTTVDPDVTDENWRARLPGDKITAREFKSLEGDVSDILWPALAKQAVPREAQIFDRRTVQMGDRLYGSIYIDLFPKDVRSFMAFFSRVLPTHIPWRINFLVESEGLTSMKFKSMLSGILSFSSGQNRLISDSYNLLKYLHLNTDESIVKLKVIASTFAPEGKLSLLRQRVSELTKAIQGWGSTDVSEVCGDPFEGFMGSCLGVSLSNPAVASVAPLSDILRMMPWTRPASPWENGAVMFRTTDGKPWPFQPGSNLQTTWIDLIYARPGSGKSVLSNALNLGLCLLGGIARLPRIAIIDIGPSSSGLISLLKDALPAEQRHYVTYHRMQMSPEYSINPFDTQLGFRYPTSLERAFLVNFVTLLSTPLGADRPYDAMADLVGQVIDEMYRNLSDEGKPSLYTPNVEPLIDSILDEIGFIKDAKSTWWEVTDVLFAAGLEHEAGLAQRYAMPLLSDAASVCRSPAIEDLYGRIVTPTGESLISAFSRMISAAVREYPILSRITAFDLGDSRIVSLDLDEVAKTGGDAADRQTAVMYMLARYIMARHYYLTEEMIHSAAGQYRNYHVERIREIREDPKKIVYDEFHRTAKSRAVREQVLVDMREGRKWNVHISLISQSVEDFDSVMIDFATAIYIMDAGPAQTVEKTSAIFGLSETAKLALRNRVHGPRAGGGTFLVQYSTKYGMNVQLLTLTLGPIELWAFSTTAEDVIVRNQLYRRLGPSEARRFLGLLFPSGSVVKELNRRYHLETEELGLISEEDKSSVINELVNHIVYTYSQNRNASILIESR